MRKLLVILMICSVALLLGCGEKKEQTTSTGSQFVGGSEGLGISFVEGTPPPEVLDKDQPFGISIKLSNKGEYDIEDASKVTVKLTGFDPADFGVSASDMEQKSPEPLLGAQKDAQGNPVQGTIVTMDFPTSGASFSHQVEIAGSVTYNVKADVCYEYGSTANSKLCVLEDILGTTGKKGELCTISEKKTVDKSGAPVQVESFTESVSSANKVAFVFKVKHTGSGDVHEKGSTCGDEFNLKNKVTVKVDTGITDGLTCSGLQNGQASGSTYEGVATLLNGEREIRCTQTISSPSDFEKLVRIDLGYDYSQNVIKTVQVKHLG
ncbi:MAG: hypothetical protein ACE5DM_00205 [Candidatus Nanoarchaeia archaeon]